MRKQYNAYLTVYLSLVFGIVLSLLFVFIEGAAIGAVRAQSELVADLGLDSVFAEYNREILNQYELFFIDSSYGKEGGGTGMVESHLSKYMEYNMTPDKDLLLFGEDTFLKLRNPYLEIEEAAFASDDNGLVWKAQAVQYMKAVYGGDIVSGIKEHIDTVKQDGLMERDVAKETAEYMREFEEALAQKGITELGAESEEGYSYQKAANIFDEIVGGALMTLTMPEGKSVSGAVMDSGPYFSSRKKNGKINKGTGLHEGAEKPDGIIDELIYDEYLMKMCGNFCEPKDAGLLKYQTEYILYGLDSDAGNIKRTVEVMFMLRAAANMKSISSDSVKKAEAKVVAAVICALLRCPDLLETLTVILLCVWALAEAVADMHRLFGGGRVPLIKDSGEWCTDLVLILSGNIRGFEKDTGGLSYQDYMRIFLGVMNKATKMDRSLDIVEMDIRKTGGNAHFRIDRCIDYLNVNFGFEDANGHDFVFRKKMCYE